MSHYALVVMVEHGHDANLPELSSRRPRKEAERYYIAANDDEMAQIASDYGLDAEHRHLRQAEAPMIEVDAAQFAARSIEAEGKRKAEVAQESRGADPTTQVRLAELDQAVGLIATRGQPTRESVQVYLERIEHAYTRAV